MKDSAPLASEDPIGFPERSPRVLPIPRPQGILLTLSWQGVEWNKASCEEGGNAERLVLESRKGWPDLAYCKLLKRRRLRDRWDELLKDGGG